MKFLSLLTLVSLLLISSCSKDNKKSSSGEKPQQEPQQENEVQPPVTPDVVDNNVDIDASIDGQYLAVFETLNLKVTNKLTGAFTFSREKEIDEVVGDVRLTNAGPALLHSQHVRIGTRCPGPQDDTNQDGIIDAVEGEAVYGGVFFPLDGDLTSQASYDDFFPVGDVYGNYYYSEVAKFTDFISDLRSQDTSNGYFKLQPREPMNLIGRVVVVNGVDANTDLPLTVGTVSNLASHQTLPIVCGVIKKVVSRPGTINDGIYNRN